LLEEVFMGGTLMVVRADQIEQLPEGVRQYVADHFKEMDLLGMAVLRASERYGWDWQDHESWKRGHMRGIAPTNQPLFPEYRAKYEVGLPEGQNLRDWIKAHPELVATISVSGEREAFMDDD
jgi:hypothetical protein